MTIDHVALHSSLQPDRLVALDLASGQQWTYGAFDRAIGCWAAVLDTHGVRGGDRVACLAKNSVELILAHLACVRLGAIFVPMNLRLTSVEINDLLLDAEPMVLIGDASLAQHGFAGLLLSALALEASTVTPRETREIDEDAVSLILYTSGTSGRPKGVMLTERNLAETAGNFSVLGQVTRDSRFLIDAPMFHIIGLVTSVRPALLQGGAIFVSDGFIPARTLVRLADPDLGVSHYFCVPQMANRLRQSPEFRAELLKRLTGVFTGGAPHPAAEIRAWIGLGVPIVDGFGMSEAGTVFGMPVRLDAIDSKAGSVGVSTPAVRTRVVDAAGIECPPGVPGELLLKGLNIFGGYWRRPQESRDCFTEDGWFRSGDIALRDAEGFYWIVDRKKDMYISGGENVYPAEIESVLAGLHGLKEAAVIGVPDAQWGEVGIAVLVREDPDAITEEIVEAFLLARLARFKLPKRYVFTAELPRTGSGKVSKKDLKLKLSQ